MSTISKTRSSGFTLIELLIAVVVLSVLISLAVPGFRIWLQNAQIRNAAESVLSGLQRARAEAIMNNRNVEFVLGGTDDSTCAPNCSDWTVKFAGGVDIDKRSSKEGSADVKRTTVLSTDASKSKTTVTFNNLGNRVTNADGTSSFTAVTFDSNVLPSADSRELTIQIGVLVGGSVVGGTVRMCDPNGSGSTKC